MSPVISVVMPVHNGVEYVRESINSICNQTWRDFELIVIDDNSTDETDKVLRELTDERIIVDRNIRKMGPAQSRNRGMSMARGEYIACMDADDVAVPGRLELQIDFLSQHTDIALVGGAATTIDSDGRPVDTHYPPNDPHQIKEQLLDSNCFVQSSVMMRSAAVRQVGGYRFPLAEDYDLWLRMSEHYELANLSVPLVFYRTHSTQTSIQQIETLAMWTLAARHAARTRRNNLSDPMSGVAQVSPKVLRDLGVNQKDIDDALADSFLLRLKLLILMNREVEALRQTKDLVNSELVTRKLRNDIAARILDLARQYYSQQRYATSRALLNLSVSLDPQLLSTAKTIELGFKSALGNRGTRFLKGIKRAVARRQSSSV